MTKVLWNECVTIIINDCSWNETSLPVVIDNHSIFPLVVNQNTPILSVLCIIEPLNVLFIFDQI